MASRLPIARTNGSFQSAVTRGHAASGTPSAGFHDGQADGLPGSAAFRAHFWSAEYDSFEVRLDRRERSQLDIVDFVAATECLDCRRTTDGNEVDTDTVRNCDAVPAGIADRCDRTGRS